MSSLAWYRGSLPLLVCILGCGGSEPAAEAPDETLQAEAPAEEIAAEEAAQLVIFFVTSDPHPAEVYLIPQSVVDRSPDVINALSVQDRYFRGNTGPEPLPIEDVERAYWLVLKRGGTIERRPIRLRPGATDTMMVALPQ